MDSADPGERLDATERMASGDPAEGPEAGPQDGPGEGPGQGTPQLALEGFCGPLDHLLHLARAQAIDLARLPLSALVDQLRAALRQAPAALPLAQKGDWVVMAAWLVQLRTRLLLPPEAPEQEQAAREAGQLRARLAGLQAMQGLAAWLERRPQLGQEVFARGRPEVFGVAADGAQAVDVVEFLWASLALFDDATGPDAAAAYQPRPLVLHGAGAARARILRRLAENPAGGPLAQFLPEPPDAAVDETRQALLRRSAWASTLIASLELARQGTIALDQAEAFATIQLTQPAAGQEAVPNACFGHLTVSSIRAGLPRDQSVERHESHEAARDSRSTIQESPTRS